MLLGNLIRNERLKLYKKVSTWVLIAIAVVLTAGSACLMAFIEAGEGYDSNQGNYTYIDQYKDQIEQTQSQLTTAKDEEKADYEEQIDAYKYLIKNKIDPRDWHYDVVFQYFSLKYSVQSFQDAQKNSVSSPDAAWDYFPDVSLEVQTAEMNKYKAYLDSNDWRQYLKDQINDLPQFNNGTEAKQDTQAQVDLYKMCLQYNVAPCSQKFEDDSGYMPEDETKYWKFDGLNTVYKDRLNLLHETNNSNTILTPDQRVNIQLEIDSTLKRIQTNTPPVTTKTLPGFLDVCFSNPSFLGLILIVFAGAIIATEFSSGAVKLLLITPHRRQSIFWSKVVILIEVTLIAAGANLVMGFLTSGLLTGFKGILAFDVVPLFGKPVLMPFLVYVLLKYLLNLLPAFCYGAMALMFSAVTRKTAVSIAIPLILQSMGAQSFSLTHFITVASMEAADSHIPGLKFVLFSNSDLSRYLYTATDPLISAVGTITSISADSAMTLTFSVFILALYMFCFLFIARDSFCRRDIR